MRWGIGRLRYRVPAGLYAVGEPGATSPVLVSANYKLSFDRLRSSLQGLDAWILVLDTKGINVWCAAGKGTFGTDEIVRRIEAVSLGQVVSHRTLVVPQLGAPGVAAHEVQQRSGFRVVYGPVRAEDIREFLAAGMQATNEMRTVRFTLRDRIAVMPVELVHWSKTMAIFALVAFLLAGVGRNGYHIEAMLRTGPAVAAILAGAFLSSIVLVPVLLPWLPGRALALKGVWIGAALVAVLAACWQTVWAAPLRACDLAVTALIVPAITSFVGMSFSGSTTYASLSGVRREMRIAVPIQATAAVAGAILWLAGRFLGGPFL